MAPKCKASNLELCYARFATKVTHEVRPGWYSCQIERESVVQVFVDNDERNVLAAVRGSVNTKSIRVEVVDADLSARGTKSQAVSART